MVSTQQLTPFVQIGRELRIELGTVPIVRLRPYRPTEPALLPKQQQDDAYIDRRTAECFLTSTRFGAVQR